MVRPLNQCFNGYESAEFQRKSSSRSRRSEEHTSELQSQSNLVCRLLLEKKKQTSYRIASDTHSHKRQATYPPSFYVLPITIHHPILSPLYPSRREYCPRVCPSYCVLASR